MGERRVLLGAQWTPPVGAVDSELRDKPKLARWGQGGKSVPGRKNSMCHSPETGKGWESGPRPPESGRTPHPICCRWPG